MANANRQDDKLMDDDLNMRDRAIPRGGAGQGAAGSRGKSSGSRGSSKGSKGAGSRAQSSKGKQKNR